MPASTPPWPRIAAENQPFPLNYLLFHESVGVVFLAIPKVGCSSLKRWLIGLTDPQALTDHDLNIHQYALERLSLACRSAGEVAEILASTPILAVVRDPADRLRSAFVEKLVRPEPAYLFEPALELLTDWFASRGATAPDLERGITFREFVDHVCESQPLCLDAHFRPQSEFLSPPADQPKVLVPLSELSIALDAVASSVGRPDCRAVRSNVTRKERSDWQGHEHLADITSAELRRLNLRPTVEELADGAIAKQIRGGMAADQRLHVQALQSFEPGRLVSLLGYRRRPTTDLRSPTI